jgi:hypothetical protein
MECYAFICATLTDLLARLKRRRDAELESRVINK